MEKAEKEVQESLSRITEIITEVRENSAHKDDVVKKEEFDRVTKSYIDAGEKIQKQEQDILALKAAMQQVGLGKGGNVAPEDEHKNIFMDFIKNGDVADYKKGFAELESKSTTLGSFSGEAGGYTIPKVMSADIIRRVFEYSPIRQLATVSLTTSNSLTFSLDVEEASATWSGETTSQNTPTDQADYGQKTIAVHRMLATGKITQDLLDDSVINFETEVSSKISDKFGRAEGAAFVNGNSAGQPRGFMTYAAGSSTYNRDQIEQVDCGASGSLTGLGLIALQGALKPEYDVNARWVMKRATYTEVLKLMYTDNKFDALNRAGVQGDRLRLLDKEVVLANDMPIVGNDLLPVAYGDFRRGYRVVDRTGITLLRDPYTQTPFVLFKFHKRVGGDVLNTEAIKIGKTPS